jgi:diguanylate cyclase (GGDEF)-like protein/PAS domain S-box-containing protein
MRTLLRNPKRWLPAALSLFFGLAVTAAACLYAMQRAEQARAGHIEAHADALLGTLQRRLDACQEALQASLALLQAEPATSPAQWVTFLSNLKLDERSPALRAIGFAPVPGGPGLLHTLGIDPVPSAPAAPELLAEPAWRNAMARARDTARPALAEPANDAALRHDELLLFVPVYHPDLPVTTVTQRRQALHGWIFSVLHMPALMHDLTVGAPADISLYVYDAETQLQPRLLFASPGENTAAAAETLHDRRLDVAGRPWLVSVRAHPQPLSGAAHPALNIGLGGLLLSLLLGVLTWRLGTAEKRAMDLAGQMTRAWHAAEQRQRAILQSTADGLITIDPQAIVRSFNGAAERMFGYRAEEVIGRNVSMLMPERYRAGHDGHVASVEGSANFDHAGLQREVIGLHRDGSEFPVRIAVTRVPGSQGIEYVGLISDISARKRVEQGLADALHLQESILACTPFAVIATDAQGLIRSFNPAAERLFGYRADEVLARLSPCALLDAGELSCQAEELSTLRDRSLDPGPQSLFERARLGATEQREWTARCKGGEMLPVEVWVTRLEGDGDAGSGFLLIAHDISMRKKTQAYVEHLARHDALTGLPNRLLMEDRLQQAIEQARRHDRKVGVIMLDVDHFKRINDSLGHHVGDELLLLISQRVQSVLRKVDTVARMGGDEFVFILPDIGHGEDVNRVCEQILGVFAQPLRVGSHEITVTPSLGVCCFPDNGANARTLLKHADTAMYQAKDAGRGGFRHFEHSMLRRNERRLEMETALRKALARQELSLELQPQVRLGDARLIGSEALLRWKHAQLGRVSPAQFVPLAEEMGLIEAIGAWVLGEACRQTVQAQRRLQRDDLMVAVNLSPRQFFQGRLIETIKGALADSALPPQCLEVEITEGVMIENADHTIELLRRLRDLGVRIAIDDFGTGYSSLAYITRFPIDRLKIDQSFIRNVTHDANDAAVASAIIILGHTLDLSVLAEGVETEDQLRFLKQRDCDIAQGYYFGRPQRLQEFLRNAA